MGAATIFIQHRGAVVKHYLVHYFEGFNKKKCLIIAHDENEAIEQFYKAHPKLRSYNVLRGPVETTTKIFGVT